jgi:multicomponent Na+:H+ antiporter subunit E
MTQPNPWNLLAWGRLLALFLKELALSTWLVLRAALAPRLAMRPAIVAVPMQLRSRAGVVLVADMVTLTPGTTSLHVSQDLQTLYVHAMDAPDAEALAANIRDGFEAATRKVLP